MDNEPDSATRFEIDSRRFKKDVPSIGCFMVWALGILGFVCGTAWSGFWGLAACGGALLLLVAVMILLGLRWSRVQTLEVTSGQLTVTSGNDPKAAVRIDRTATLELTLENVDDSDGTEATATLNLWDISGGCRRRHTLGWWISEEDKVEVFDALLRFLVGHGFNVEARNDVATRTARRKV